MFTARAALVGIPSGVQPSRLRPSAKRQRLDSVGPKMGAGRRTTLNRGSEVGEAIEGVSRHDRPARGVGAGRRRPYASVTDRTFVARWRLAKHLRIPQIYTGAV